MIAPHTLLGAALIGVAVGFLGGLLGKGGSAIATPLLHAIGVPAIIAVAAPLPATIPSTLAASWVYWKEHYLDSHVVRTCVVWGVPSTIVGAIATNWISGGLLVRLTDAVLVALGVRLLAHRSPAPDIVAPADDDRTGSGGGIAVASNVTAAVLAPSATTLAIVAILVGFSAGLLANSGGFLMAPLLITVVKLPIRSALASSLAVSAVLAVPGTIVHAALGHIDWALVAVFAATSVPLSITGARVALRIDANRLERIYGAVLLVLGGVFLVTG
ncbi:MAG: sulfite exporter TauE/SafE family protein [Ilumatobacteraceae bacterium]